MPALPKLLPSELPLASAPETGLPAVADVEMTDVSGAKPSSSAAEPAAPAVADVEMITVSAAAVPDVEMASASMSVEPSVSMSSSSTGAAAPAVAVPAVAAGSFIDWSESEEEQIGAEGEIGADVPPLALTDVQPEGLAEMPMWLRRLYDFLGQWSDKFPRNASDIVFDSARDIKAALDETLLAPVRPEVAKQQAAERASKDKRAQEALPVSAPTSGDIAADPAIAIAAVRRVMTPTGVVREAGAPLTSSMALNVAAFNLGETSRVARAPGGGKLREESQKLTNLVITESSAHVTAVCEGASLMTPKVQKILRERGLLWCSSSDNNLVVLAKGNITTQLTPMEEHLTGPVPYFVATASFGEEGPPAPADAPAEATAPVTVTRAGLPSVCICVYHVHNKDAKLKMGKVKTAIRQMLCAVAKFECDVLCGDGNAAAYSFFNRDKQREASFLKSALHLHVERLCDFYRREQWFWTPRLHFATNNLITEFEQPFDPVNTELDCMLCHVIEWGHAFAAQSADESAKTKAEFRVRSSERIKSFENASLWLQQSDQSWHRPLMLNLRYFPERNIHRGVGVKRSLDAARAQQWQQSESWGERGWQRRGRSWQGGGWQGGGWQWEYR